MPTAGWAVPGRELPAGELRASRWAGSNRQGVALPGNAPDFPALLFFPCWAMPGHGEQADRRDSQLQDVLGQSQGLATLPRAGHLRESWAGAALNRSVRNSLPKDRKLSGRGAGAALPPSPGSPSPETVQPWQGLTPVPCVLEGWFGAGVPRGWRESSTEAHGRIYLWDLPSFPLSLRSSSPPAGPSCAGDPRGRRRPPSPPDVSAGLALRRHGGSAPGLSPSGLSCLLRGSLSAGCVSLLSPWGAGRPFLGAGGGQCPLCREPDEGPGAVGVACANTGARRGQGAAVSHRLGFGDLAGMWQGRPHGHPASPFPRAVLTRGGDRDTGPRRHCGWRPGQRHQVTR